MPDTQYRFSFGPWNIHEGEDPFGPAVRAPYAFDEKLPLYKSLGFDGVQFHDDDAVPDVDKKSPRQIRSACRVLNQRLGDEGLVAEFVAPRLWFTEQTIDGAYTSNNAEHRAYAIDRTKRTIDIARELGTRDVVLWLAREGTYIREAKNARQAVAHLVDALNAMLDHDAEVRLLVEPKPNEPMDQAYIPTIGHAIALSYLTSDPSRVGGLIESAHALLAGLDPSDEMAYALAHGKLWSVHLNDQNGLKFDEDKSFGSANLRGAFNQVRVLDEYGYGKNGEFVGLDVKAMRTQPRELARQHLTNSRQMFDHLLAKVRTLDKTVEQQYRDARDYEGLEGYILRHLMGVR
ncbi:TIM barrel protein [Candidatus Poribacteria bacterium]|nr:TIM barrel protein [Candidatus Poribacteria bacterium]